MFFNFRKGANRLQKFDIVKIVKFTGDPSQSNFYIEKMIKITNAKQRLGKPLRFVPPSLSSPNITTRKPYNPLEDTDLFDQCSTSEERELLNRLEAIRADRKRSASHPEATSTATFAPLQNKFIGTTRPASYSDWPDAIPTTQLLECIDDDTF